MITLAYVPYGGTTLADADVGGWAATVATGGSCEVLISQIGLVHPVIAAALKNGNPEEVQLLWDGKLLPVNKYGALHGRWPIGPDHDAAEEIMEHAVRLRKEEETKPLTMLTPEQSAKVDATILTFAPTNSKIDAIKALRSAVKIDLRAAKDYVESIFATYVADLEKEDCSDEVVEAHIKALWAYNKVNAIIWVRDRYRMNLREAKERTEDIVWREGVPQSDYEREEGEDKA